MIKPLLLSASTILLFMAACSQASSQVSGQIFEQDSGHTSPLKSDMDWSILGQYEHTLSDESLTLKRAGTHLLVGKSNAGIKVDTDGNIRLVLSGVNIQSEKGAAIYIANAKNTVIELAAGSENYLEDASSREDNSIDGAIYSSDDLILQGSGQLSITANFQDGIVSKDDLNILGGHYNISSIDDGIRGKDSLVIEGGTISIISQDDGVKSSNENDPEKGSIHIKDGTITVQSGDDGFSAVNNIVVDGGQINVLESVEGMEASTITFNGGDITIVASDDGINAVNDNGLGNMSIIVNGGNIDVTVGHGDTDAFDSNGTILIAGGSVNVTAPTSSFDSNRGNQMTGGHLIVNGETLTEIPSGRGRGRGRRARGEQERR